MSAADTMPQRQADEIARPVFEHGLSTVGNDTDDFRDINKVTLGNMLDQAYRAGQAKGAKA